MRSVSQLRCIGAVRRPLVASFLSPSTNRIDPTTRIHAHSRHGGAFFWQSSLPTIDRRWQEVVCLDNFFTGERPISPLLGHPKLRARAARRHRSFQDRGGSDLQSRPAASPPLPSTTHQDRQNSVMGAINCLGLAKRVKAAVFQASTSEVYGGSAGASAAESYWGHVNPIGKRACYDEAALRRDPLLRLPP